MSIKNEVTEDWAAYKAHQKAERTARMERALAKLKACGLPFTTGNGGVHCVFDLGERRYDVWPSTGRWRIRNGGPARFGIDAFISYYKLQQHERDTAYVRSMERAYPHLKGETL
jgi:hypothetical protein